MNESEILDLLKEIHAGDRVKLTYRHFFGKKKEHEGVVERLSLDTLESRFSPTRAVGSDLESLALKLIEKYLSDIAIDVKCEDKDYSFNCERIVSIRIGKQTD